MLNYHLILEKKAKNKLFICKLQLKILIFYVSHTENKKDIEKNVDLPNPRDLQTRFQELERKQSKIKDISSFLKSKTSNKNFLQKIIFSLNVKLEKITTRNYF